MSVARHEHRAFGVTHDGLGVGAQQIGRHARPMRAHDDQIRSPSLGFRENLGINRAETQRRRHQFLWIVDLRRRLREFPLRALAQPFIEIAGTYSMNASGIRACTLTSRISPGRFSPFRHWRRRPFCVMAGSLKSIGVRIFLYNCPSVNFAAARAGPARFVISIMASPAGARSVFSFRRSFSTFRFLLTGLGAQRLLDRRQGAVDRVGSGPPA